jgi:hypothetical protein
MLLRGWGKFGSAGVPPAKLAWERGRPARKGVPGSAGVSPARLAWERGRLARKVVRLLLFCRDFVDGPDSFFWGFA